ncbi:hypothetical protein [Clostridium sp.]|uniref:hypothetical protein n=1 Tax=Clostridium sp. TaxID=1506 RepID=UPI0035A11FDC
MLKVIIPEDNKKLDRQIKALEYAIQHDTNEKDKCIHQKAYDRLVEERNRRKEIGK